MRRASSASVRMSACEPRRAKKSSDKVSPGTASARCAATSRLRSSSPGPWLQAASAKTKNSAVRMRNISTPDERQGQHQGQQEGIHQIDEEGPGQWHDEV